MLRSSKAGDADRIISQGWGITVGVAGWSIGGGHGPFDNYAGLGVDSIFEAEAGGPVGELVIANEKTNADLCQPSPRRLPSPTTRSSRCPSRWCTQLGSLPAAIGQLTGLYTLDLTSPTAAKTLDNSEDSMNAGTGCPKTMYSTVQSTPPVALQFAGNPLQGCVVGTSLPRHAEDGRSFFIATVYFREFASA